ncbi:hypothetical protein DPEC_G00242690 [Dallia pectoralis]|uniref:Uncharacterized protein n=1 Tax=Dallia pectoralis TaxID=75939 RepID=A0ACC2FV02_DALPE|nr:hypothetical protein DPEC_G00242690 [Dallia pectoralis]
MQKEVKDEVRATVGSRAPSPTLPQTIVHLPQTHRLFGPCEKDPRRAFVRAPLRLGPAVRPGVVHRGPLETALRVHLISLAVPRSLMTIWLPGRAGSAERGLRGDFTPPRRCVRGTGGRRGGGGVVCLGGGSSEDGLHVLVCLPPSTSLGEDWS